MFTFAYSATAASAMVATRVLAEPEKEQSTSPFSSLSCGIFCILKFDCVPKTNLWVEKVDTDKRTKKSTRTRERKLCQSYANGVLVVVATRLQYPMKKKTRRESTKWRVETERREKKIQSLPSRVTATKNKQRIKKRRDSRKVRENNCV